MVDAFGRVMVVVNESVTASGNASDHGDGDGGSGHAVTVVSVNDN